MILFKYPSELELLIMKAFFTCDKASAVVKGVVRAPLSLLRDADPATLTSLLVGK